MEEWTSGGVESLEGVEELKNGGLAKMNCPGALARGKRLTPGLALAENRSHRPVILMRHFAKRFLAEAEFLFHACPGLKRRGKFIGGRRIDQPSPVQDASIAIAHAVASAPCAY